MNTEERNRHAILKDKKVFPINNVVMWARWFETMVFGGPLDGECVRYTTYEQAELGHKKMLARMKEKTK